MGIDKKASHAIQVKIPKQKTPVIILLWEDGTQHTIPVLSLVRGICKNGKRPYGFWYEPNQPTYGISREDFMRWLHEEFIHIFDKYMRAFNSHVKLINYREN